MAHFGRHSPLRIVDLAVRSIGAGASSPRFKCDDWLFVDQLEIIRKLLIEARLRACIIPNRLSGHIIGVENAANDCDAKQEGRDSKKMFALDPGQVSQQFTIIRPTVPRMATASIRNMDDRADALRLCLLGDD